MRVEKNFFLLCENFMVDNAQRASIINIYDTVFAENFPATHAMLRFASNVSVSAPGSKKSISFRLVIESKAGEKLAEIAPEPAKIAPKLPEQNIGAVFEVQMLTFPQPGAYTARLFVDDGPIAEYKIFAKSVLPPEK